MKLHNRTPDIENLLRIFRREVPSRPTLFELFLNGPLYERLAGRKAKPGDYFDDLLLKVEAFAAAGYDYASTQACQIGFPTGDRGHGKKTISLNEGFVITDEASFQAYAWPDPESYDYSLLEKIVPHLPGNMKLMIMGPGGVLENTIALVGYENLCFMLHDNEPLARAVFDAVGSRLLKYYEIAVQYDSVGFLMSNDDWGFNTQPFLSPEAMREYVFPWHKRFAEAAHRRGKPIALHSCGNLEQVMDDVIDDIGFDAKHSFEDVILPIEQVYDRYSDRIALFGGIDLDFIIRSDEEALIARCRGMLERAAGKGGYALGTGNSVPEYIPQEKYLSMIQVALRG